MNIKEQIFLTHQWSISPTFTSSFYAFILSPKNLKAKLGVEKSFKKRFCTKKLLVNVCEIDTRKLFGGKIDPYNNFGTIEFILPDYPFMVRSSQRSANIGKIFIVKLLESMYMSGYDFMFSSDLSRYKDQSTLFFRKSPMGLPERRAKKIICIAPGINFIYKLDEYKSEKLAHFMLGKQFPSLKREQTFRI